MPVGEQAAGGSLGTIFYPARPTARSARGQLRHLFPRFLYGRGLSSQHGVRLFRDCRVWRAWHLATHLVAPRESIPPGFEAGEITAAHRAAMRTGPETQKKPGPPGRIIVVLHPAGQFLPIAAGAARVPPGSIRPNAGFPAVISGNRPIPPHGRCAPPGFHSLDSPVAWRKLRRSYRPACAERHRIPRMP
jgi:hypothetical protein